MCALSLSDLVDMGFFGNFEMGVIMVNPSWSSAGLMVLKIFFSLKHFDQLLTAMFRHLRLLTYVFHIQPVV